HCAINPFQQATSCRIQQSKQASAQLQPTNQKPQPQPPATRNLLLNAIKYTKQGGVWVKWARNEKPGRAAFWVLTVQDSGPGIASNALPRVTSTGKPANSAPASAERSEGLGLPIVRRLCALLDAVVEVHTVKGQGTTFQVSFPIRYSDS
ncbi:MAG: ATP-binding protein, partial [Gammaproteobacteria bacterium]